MEALAERGLGRHLSVGGALGLFHYLDYRTTSDVDAWWDEKAGMDERHRVLAVVREVLEGFGEVTERGWGEVRSLELKRDGKKVFSFQVARRSARLEPTRPAPWVDVQLDSLTDLIASKMSALVERGAPRDFRDIHALCRARLVESGRCWELWRQRQELTGYESDRGRARLSVETHLERLESLRPLDSIPEGEDRRQAESVRSWFREVFLVDEL